MRSICHRGVREAGRNELRAGEQVTINPATFPEGRYALCCNEQRRFMQSHPEVGSWPATEAP